MSHDNVELRATDQELLNRVDLSGDAADARLLFLRCAEHLRNTGIIPPVLRAWFVIGLEQLIADRPWPGMEEKE